METNRSQDHEEGSYSEDFEQDVESQDSPRSEEKVQIRVFKTAIGSLTVQPQKIFKTKSFSDRTPGTRTMSETSLCKKKQTEPAIKHGGGGSGGVKINESKTSLVRLGTHCVRRQKPLAQEKVDPHDVPPSASVLSSAGSLSRISLQRNIHSPYSKGAIASSIRRVVAHTSINEKSYASAKYKAYVNPPLHQRGGNINPPLRAGGCKQSTTTSQRVASAKRMTIMDLKSSIKLQQDEIEKLKKENRFLNHLHHRQDNALKKWEGKDAELPRLLNQHKDEIRSLQEQLKRAQAHARDHNEKLQTRDKKIVRLETELEKLRTLVHEEHLQDRHTLQQDLDITRMNLVGAEKRIREYMRHVDILEKNHRHQLAAQEKKLIKQNTHAYELQAVVANLRLALRNKDRMLNYIQMRSSGRSLIRAYHAEKVGAGHEELLFGSSISSDLNRPYQPPILKSHSFDFGNSRCETAALEDKRDYELFLGKRHSDDHKINYGETQRNRNKKGSISRSRPASRTSLSLESVIAPRIATPSKKSESKIKKTKSVAARESKEKHDKEKCEREVQKSKSKPVKSILKASHKSKDEIEIEESSDEEEEEEEEEEEAQHISKDKGSIKQESPRKKGKKSSKKRDSKRSVKAMEEKASIKTLPSDTALKGVESKEFIYRGSSTGFKYEGPFMKSNTDIHTTEMLLSPKSNENNSEHSLSYSQSSSSSSTKSEIISNIDILSARIRDSCVRVPPPEAKPASPPTGPGGDNNSTQLSPQPPPILMAQEINNNSSQFQPGVLQQFQLYSADVQDGNPSSSQQTFTATSPRIQLNPVSLSNVIPTSPPTETSPQFQLVQQNVGYMQANEPTCQVIDAIQYSPRMAQSYPAYSTVSVMADPQTILGTLNHQDQFNQNASYPVEFPYFSFTTQDNSSQPTSVTIIQTNPAAYDQQISSTRPSNASLPSHSQSQFNTNQNQPKPSQLPPVGYFNSGPVNEREQTFPNPNGNSKANQSSYNPSYYVNLGSWK